MNRLRIGTALVLALLLAACGGGSGSGTSADTATLTGTLGTGGAARVAARTVAATAGDFYVEAVDETGTVQDSAQGLQAGDSFELRVPAGHTYVIVVGDAMGPLGGAVYDPAAGRADFEVPAGVTHLVLGTLDVDPDRREVEMEGDGDPLAPAEHMEKPEDNDGDHIPDFADWDDDNDGIPDDLDQVAGVDTSKDHDNDGVVDRDDEDDDGDGVADTEDAMRYDHDNDGVDDDRSMGQVGDAAVGAGVYADNGCAACHGDDGSGGTSGESVRGVSAHELAEVLLRGEDEGEEHEGAMGDDDGEESDDGGQELGMRAFPDLVPYAADLAAFLSGQAGSPAAGTQPTDTGSQTPPADAGTQTPSSDTGTQPPMPTADGQAVFDSICSSCHVLGSYDTMGFAPDLSGKGALVSSKFGGGANHMGNTLTDAEIQVVADFLNAN
ncbi:c-type cytochrome [Deferrisoma camini]|uniref:c-type cytochrome n=1 Tax=Deferrisoma camini TaxID=1035120 RepID=UPI00046CEA95|nr:cytochrome c [Deferrisoma camini]